MPIRSAQVPDYPVFARLYEELETGDPTPAPQTFEHDLMADVLVFERDGDVVGYTYFQVLDGVGTIRHIVTDTQCRGQGVGRALMAEVAARVRAQGSDRWCLNVKPDNQPAVALYTRMGMQFQYASVAMRMGWDIIERLPPPQPGTVVSVLQTEDEAEVERAFVVAAGLIAVQRNHGGARPLVARRNDNVVGATVYIPGFPGAYPFRATNAAAVRALLEAMHPHADARFDYVQLVLEDAAALAQALREVGATPHLEFVHYAGAVPASGG